jgi:ATP-dependent DNA helicase PIF1
MDLISFIFPDKLLARPVTDRSTFQGRMILSPLNQSVTELNYIILARFPGVLRTYNSIDSTDLGKDGLKELPVKHLQGIDLPSLPPSKLDLKVRVPVMLLRNLCLKEGLCNRSRMIVTSLKNHCIKGRLIKGDFDGELRTIPRLKLHSGEKDLTFTLTCKQFPVRLCFAIIINKSQGESFKKVSIDLEAPVFSHSQFYVAVLRVCFAGGLHVLLFPDSDKTENIVWPELLQI